MSKKLLIASNKKIEDYFKYVDGFIFGLDGYSVNYPFNIDLDEIKDINKLCKENNKELFISINKNIYSKEISELENILKELTDIKIDGVMFADTSVVEVKKELNLDLNLVWNQEHLTTNYNTINEWYKEGVNYTFLSCDITLNEIKEIINSSKSGLMVQVFGYFPIFTSKRFAIKNYLDYFNIKDNSKNYYLEKEGKKYPIVENKEGTFVYSNYILDGIEELKNLNIDYLIYNSFLINDEDMLEILKGNINIENREKGFLYTPTIYKVK